MEKGIVILAVGHTNYGKMAAALAASIKAVQDFPITLLWEGEAISKLSDVERNLFSLIKLPYELTHNEDDSLNALKARMHAYSLSPYDSTLFLDVDNLWISNLKPSDVFKELKDVSFTIQNAGYVDCIENIKPHFSVWAELPDVIKAYNIEGKKFYRLFGEFIYFKKDEVAKKLFDQALEVFNSKPDIKVTEFIGQKIPDELAFSIAMAKTGIYPHKDNYYPTSYYFTVSLRKDTFKAIYELSKKYLLMSMGGSSSPKPLVEKYNSKIKLVYKELGLSNPYQWINKKNYIKTR
jgi:hypothetical protein